jgi:hypothetical protein
MRLGIRVVRPSRARVLAVSCVVAIFGLLVPGSVSAQAPGLGQSAELVDPHTFRVCADPHSLPFSNEAGEGFENKLAALLASKLGRPATYYPLVVGFSQPLNALLRRGHGVAVGDDQMQTTNSYYHTTYLGVQARQWIGWQNVRDQRLKNGTSASLPNAPSFACSTG